MKRREVLKNIGLGVFLVTGSGFTTLLAYNDHVKLRIRDAIDTKLTEKSIEAADFETIKITPKNAQSIQQEYGILLVDRSSGKIVTLEEAVANPGYIHGGNLSLVEDNQSLTARHVRHLGTSNKDVSIGPIPQDLDTNNVRAYDLDLKTAPQSLEGHTVQIVGVDKDSEAEGLVFKRVTGTVLVNEVQQGLQDALGARMWPCFTEQALIIKLPKEEYYTMNGMSGSKVLHKGKVIAIVNQGISSRKHKAVACLPVNLLKDQLQTTSEV